MEQLKQPAGAGDGEGICGTVFISPHHDDACFSLAGTVLASKGGHLVNVFTRSEFALAQTPSFANRDERIDYVTAMRASEDRVFADACNLTRHDLMLDEPSLRGFHPFDLSAIGAEARHIESILVEHIIGLRQAGGSVKPALFCPMAIGGHRNHVSVLVAVVNALPRLCESYSLFFYEDLPYASQEQQRNAGLLHFSGMFRDRRLGRKTMLMTPETFARKLQLVNIYSSQHESAPRASDFIPASVEVSQPHEATWAILPGTLAGQFEQPHHLAAHAQDEDAGIIDGIPK